jgi:hypothetical protein
MPINGLQAFQILAGGATLSVAPYSSNAGAFTGSSFGHTLAPTTFGFAFEDFDIETEQSIGRVKTLPVAANYTVKATLAQNDAAAMFMATRQTASTFLSETTTASGNLAFNDPVEVYYQLKLAGVGYGSTKVDTYRFWKCQVSSVGDISFAKKGVQSLEITWKVMRDDSVTTWTTSGYYGFRAIA